MPVNPRLAQRLEDASRPAELFELVKRAARDVLKRERAGLMLATADLGNHPQGFLGAFHYVGSNYIVMNRNPMNRLRAEHPEWYNAYVFHVLLHEYVHSLGVLDEGETRRLTHQVCHEVLGPEHVATRMAADISLFMPGLVYPEVGWQPERLVLDIDREFGIGDTSYIQ